MAEILNAKATIGVADVPENIRYYQALLGVQANVTMGDPPWLAILSYNGNDIFTVVASPAPAVAEFAGVYVNVVGVREIFDRAKALGLDLLSELTQHPWGQLDFVVRGPSGHQIAIGEKVA
jgi:catechol 2,3-dioxygenase-like lactoylglutathione lyase family enzyme